VSTTRATKIAGNKRLWQNSANTWWLWWRNWARTTRRWRCPTQVGEHAMLEAPLPREEALGEELVRGPTSSRGPISRSWLSGWRQPVLLKVGHDVSTDEISAAGAQALPFRLNIPSLLSSPSR
jgi:hypothetical protein